MSYYINKNQDYFKIIKKSEKGNLINIGFTHEAFKEININYMNFDYKPGTIINQGESIGLLESTKASIEIESLFNGSIKELNTELSNIVEENPYLEYDDYINDLKSKDKLGIILYSIESNDSIEQIIKDKDFKLVKDD